MRPRIGDDEAMKKFPAAHGAIAIAVFLTAACAIPLKAYSQNSGVQQCPNAVDTSSAHLHGLWRAQFDGLAQGATVLLEKHSELADSVQGGITRDGGKTLVAGDVDQGNFTLEESADGKTVSATWQGEVVDTSCGQEIRGVWTPVQAEARRFVLRKQGGW